MIDGQIMLMVCKPCHDAGEAECGFQLCARTTVSWFEPTGPTGEFRKWLQKHGKCGGRGNPDHFVFALANQRNFDQPKAKSVKLAIAEAIQ